MDVGMKKLMMPAKQLPAEGQASQALIWLSRNSEEDSKVFTSNVVWNYDDDDDDDDDDDA